MEKASTNSPSADQMVGELGDEQEPTGKKTPAELANEIHFLLSLDLAIAWDRLPIEYREATTDGAHRTSKSRMIKALKQIDRFTQIFELTKKRECFFVPSRESRLASTLKKRCEHTLGAVEVVPCTTSRLVARVGAIQLCKILLEMRSNNVKVAHVGFSGGRTPMLLAQDFALCLTIADSLRPPNLDSQFPRIIFHSMVGSFTWNDRASDPNGYSAYFVECPESVKDLIEFRTLPSPGISLQSERDRLRQIEIVKHSLDVNLDIVVTSCGHSALTKGEEIEHYSFWNTLDASCKSSQVLKEAWSRTQSILKDKEVVGDFAWLPVSRTEGLLPLDGLPLWAFTMFNKDQMLDFVSPLSNKGNRRGEILLLAGPCGGPMCQSKTKTSILKALLRTQKLPISHLVVDSTTAEELVANLDT